MTSSKDYNLQLSAGGKFQKASREFTFFEALVLVKINLKFEVNQTSTFTHRRLIVCLGRTVLCFLIPFNHFPNYTIAKWFQVQHKAKR